jgi:hypothetical protein
MNQFKPTPFTRKSFKEELKAAEKAANSPSPVKFDWEGAGGGAAVGAGTGAAIGSAIPVIGTIAGGIIGGAIGFFSGGKEEEKIDPKYQEQITQALTDFKDLKTDNLYAGAQNLMGGVSFDLQNREFKNQFQDARNVYADLGELRMENAFENMTVDQRAAQFQRDMFSQQQANIMQGLQGSAGGSGIAGLAQAMAQQGQLQAQQAAADIGRQERENQLRARGADMDIQRMQAQRRELIARGGMETQMARMSGAQAADQMLSQREQAIATGQFQAAQARAQGAMQAQAMRLQGETDARNLEYQKAQGMLSYYSGQQEGEYARIEADKSWLQRTFGF